MVTHLALAAARWYGGGVTIEQPSFLPDDHLASELADVRRRVDDLLERIRSFTLLQHAEPWWHLEDLLSSLRADATTVAVLERLQGRAPR